MVSAITAYAKVNANGQWIERTEQVSLNQLFDRMTREEMEAYAIDGQLPPWFEHAVGATRNDSHDDPDRGKPLSCKNNDDILGATVLGPGDFPLGSPESRMAARIRLQRIGVAGERPSECVCFPENDMDEPFYGYKDGTKFLA